MYLHRRLQQRLVASCQLKFRHSIQQNHSIVRCFATLLFLCFVTRNLCEARVCSFNRTIRTRNAAKRGHLGVISGTAVPRGAASPCIATLFCEAFYYLALELVVKYLIIYLISITRNFMDEICNT